MKTKLLALTGLFLTVLNAQNTEFAKTHLATPNEERLAYDVKHYHINLDIDLNEKSIKGFVKMDFEWLKNCQQLGFDLDDRLLVDSVIYRNQTLNFKRTPKTREILVDVLNTNISEGIQSIHIYYHGKPQIAKNAPWDGGFSWKKDENGNPWIGVSCEGDGASIWWPNKDLLSDEPDSVTFTCRYPDDLFFVSNGDMVNDIIYADYRETTWKTTLPINNYNVTLNIADYSHFSDEFKRPSGSILPLDYYVLPYNKKKAEEQFKIVKPMLSIFEKAFGEYPFSKDGYALVETPYLGMEHQSCIAYGNQYKPGYLGRYPKHMDFDFIVIHETGHEWWGNSVSMKDRSDMWIHESFCTYSEAIFVENYYGYEDMLDYLVYQKAFITHKGPIQGIPHTHESGYGTEIYYKGSWVLHTLRNLIRNDELWFNTIKKIAEKNRINSVEGVEVKQFLEKELDVNLKGFFALYFDSVNIPVIEFKDQGKYFKVKLNTNYGFNFPFKWEGEDLQISRKWTKVKKGNMADFKKKINQLFLVGIK